MFLLCFVIKCTWHFLLSLRLNCLLWNDLVSATDELAILDQSLDQIMVIDVAMDASVHAFATKIEVTTLADTTMPVGTIDCIRADVASDREFIHREGWDGDRTHARSLQEWLGLALLDEWSGNGSIVIRFVLNDQGTIRLLLLGDRLDGFTTEVASWVLKNERVSKWLNRRLCNKCRLRSHLFWCREGPWDRLGSLLFWTILHSGCSSWDTFLSLTRFRDNL